MLFGVDSATNLVIWIVFIFWKPLFVSWKSYEAYAKQERRLWIWELPLVNYRFYSFFIDVLKIVFIYLFLHFHVDFNSHFFIAVYVLFVVAELVSKTVEYCLINLRNNWMGWFAIFFMMACSAARLGLIAHSKQLGVFTGTADNIWILFVVLESIHLAYLAYLTFIRCPVFMSMFAAWAKNGSLLMLDPLIENDAIELQSTAPSSRQMRHGWKR